MIGWEDLRRVDSFLAMHRASFGTVSLPSFLSVAGVSTIASLLLPMALEVVVVIIMTMWGIMLKRAIMRVSAFPGRLLPQKPCHCVHIGQKIFHKLDSLITGGRNSLSWLCATHYSLYDTIPYSFACLIIIIIIIIISFIYSCFVVFLARIVSVLWKLIGISYHITNGGPFHPRLTRCWLILPMPYGEPRATECKAPGGEQPIETGSG